MPPERVADVLALVGDAVDNIPGVAGIGDKGARDLVREFGPVEAVLENADKVKRAAYREGLKKHREEALLSKHLVTLRTDVPVTLDLSKLDRQEPDRRAAHALFKELEFQALAREYAPEAATTGTERRVITEAAELDGPRGGGEAGGPGLPGRRRDLARAHAGRPRRDCVYAPAGNGRRTFRCGHSRLELAESPSPATEALSQASPPPRGPDRPQGERQRASATRSRSRGTASGSQGVALRRPRGLLPPEPGPAGLLPRRPRLRVPGRAARLGAGRARERGGLRRPAPRASRAVTPSSCCASTSRCPRAWRRSSSPRSTGRWSCRS